jgi:hypothetical protein
MPAEPRIVKNAEQSPGKCFVSGDNEGPFLDTGRNVKFYGRVYLALKHIRPYLQQAGYLHEDDVKNLKDEHGQALVEALALREEVEHLRALRDAVAGFVAKPEIVEKQVVVYETRDVTDEDVARFVQQHPRVLEKFKPSEPGSVDEWNDLYRPEAQRPESTPEATTPAGPEAPPSSASGGGPEADEPAAEIEVQGTAVNLDEVLAQDVNTIVDYAAGHPELGVALAEREEYTKPKGAPRKTVLRLREVTV